MSTQLTTTGQLTQAGLDTLESMLDSTNLAYIVSAIASICDAKAEHLRSNWQDAHGGLAWNRAGSRLYAVASQQPIKAVS